MGYPIHRGRRLRSQAAFRAMVAETALHINDLIYPMFVIHGQDKCLPVDSMPGVNQLSVDRLANEVKEIKNLGIPAVLLFGIPENKDAGGSSSYHDNGVVQQAIKAIKDSCPELVVVTDVCLCEYTDHGHCGLPDKSGYVDNDATLEVLARQALSHVRAGCDIVAPSDMMDGRVGCIRNCLDDNGYIQIPIMAYAAKFASSFYGPFRDAADSTPQFGDRKTYQMDYCNINEALREVAMDIEEGADLVMVKPALAYLDVIKAVKDKYNYPTVAYNVSGEYAMVKAAAQRGWINEEKITMEILTAIKRAGADLIITYAAKDAARYINR